MANPRGVFSFPGIVTWISCTVTDSPGIQPSVIMVEMLPQYGAPRATGDVVLSYEGNTVRLKDCLFDSAVYEQGSGGKIIGARLLDRRYKWQWYDITGSYNELDAAGVVRSRTEKKPQELAKLLLDAMGETNRDVSALPNSARPTVSWVAANAAQALEQLCAELGCRFCLKRDDNSIKVYRTAVGATLPDNLQYMEKNDGLDPANMPSKLKTVGAPIKYQCRLELEAVVEELDGTVVIVDDAADKPTAGWDGQDPETLSGVSSTLRDLPDGSRTSPREHYLQTYLRSYRVKEPDDDIGIIVPGYVPTGTDRKIRLWQILPLGGSLVQTYLEADDRKEQLKAFITGEWWHSHLAEYKKRDTMARLGVRSGTDSHSIANDRAVSFSIDAERGIVTTSAPVCLDDGTPAKQAKIFLHVAVTVKDFESGQEIRYTKEKTLGGTGTRTANPTVRVLAKPDIQHTKRAVYDNTGAMTSLVENTTDCDTQADYYLDAATRDYDTVTTATRRYVGIINSIQLDGAVNQITYLISGGSGGSGAFTTVSRGTEHDNVVPSFRDRQLQIAYANSDKLDRQAAIIKIVRKKD